ncbi:dATP/dGTP diphosphohydrolase domain-containing protein [Pseudoalteromonas sp.]|uniref:dATP/dGTP diphosphohydrolase domain-containing protein n=1 Tax=Pseudoalteromonas sp. TaxID=53249 RepID=UPI00338E2D84
MEDKIKLAKRKDFPMYTGLIKYFPKALKAVAFTSLEGNRQHHSDKPLHWDKNKSNDHYDCLVRHLSDHSIEPLDDDGVYHLTKVAWRALAALEIFLDEQE